MMTQIKRSPSSPFCLLRVIVEYSGIRNIDSAGSQARLWLCRFFCKINNRIVFIKTDDASTLRICSPVNPYGQGLLVSLVESQHFLQVKTRQIVSINNKECVLRDPMPVCQQGAGTAQQSRLMIEDYFHLLVHC